MRRAGVITGVLHLGPAFTVPPVPVPCAHLRHPLWTCLRELNVTFCAAILHFLTCRFCAYFVLVYDVVHPSSQIRACPHKRWFSY